jgi:hypothetical protein
MDMILQPMGWVRSVVPGTLMESLPQGLQHVALCVHTMMRCPNDARQVTRTCNALARDFPDLKTIILVLPDTTISSSVTTTAFSVAVSCCRKDDAPGGLAAAWMQAIHGAQGAWETAYFGPKGPRLASPGPMWNALARNWDWESVRWEMGADWKGNSGLTPEARDKVTFLQYEKRAPEQGMLPRRMVEVGGLLKH